MTTATEIKPRQTDKTTAQRHQAEHIYHSLMAMLAGWDEDRENGIQADCSDEEYAQAETLALLAHAALR